MKHAIRSLAATLITSASLFAQGPAAVSAGRPAAPVALDYEAVRLTRIAVAVRASGELQIDGRLDETDWSLAVPAADFIQRLPSNGAPAEQQTEVRFLYRRRQPVCRLDLP